MSKVEIINGTNILTLNFTDDSERFNFQRAVLRCIEKPKIFTHVLYKDKTDEIIFTAEYLKLSLLKFTNENN